MDNEKQLSVTISPDTLTDVVKKEDQLPRGSLWHLETALTYARKVKLECADGGNLEVARDWCGVVIEQLEEIKKKGEKGK